MAWLIGILKFIFATIGFFATGLCILNTVSAIINPQITVNEGQVTEKNANARIMFLIIASLCWGVVIALP